MPSPDSPPSPSKPWLSLWIIALFSLLAQLALCQFFSFGKTVPISIDINPSNLWKLAYHFPPTGSFQVLNWLGVPYLPQPLTPFNLAANLPIWLFFTVYAPVMATLALLAMAAFLRELELPRPAALFGGVIYAWQGDIITFVYPGHYGYIATWPFYAIGAWGALRAQRTHHWAYALISGACCGIMVALQPDRGGIASLLIVALYLTPFLMRSLRAAGSKTPLFLLALCLVTAAVIALAPLLTLFQGNIVGVKMGGTSNRNETYDLVTQFSIGPAETLTYLVPGFFGWHINSISGPYWSWVGEWPEWPKTHQGTRNLTLALSTIGTIATVLALIGACLLLPGRLLGADQMSGRQRLYCRVLLALGAVTLVLAWGWHTPLYRPLFLLPLMDKWRDPLKWMEMTNFALVVLSAAGMQHLIAALEAVLPEAKIARRRLTGFMGGTLFLLVLGLLASYPLAIVLTVRLEGEGFDLSSIVTIIDTLHASLLGALALLFLAFISWIALAWPHLLRSWKLGENPWIHRLWDQALRPESLPMTLTVSFALMAVLQLAWVDTKFIEPTPLAGLTQVTPLLARLASEGDRVRVSVATEDQTLTSYLENQFSALDISCLEISAASRIPDNLNAFLQDLDNNRARLWLLAGVKNVALPEQELLQLREDSAIAANIDHVDGYTIGRPETPDLPTHALVAMKDYLAKATLVPKAEFLTTDEAVLKRLADPAWNPRQSLLLNHPTMPAPASSGSSELDEVALKTYTPTDIAIEAQSEYGGYVLINDLYDPDWQVQVNDHAAELLPADYLMRAVAIPPGSSTIRMHYVPRYHIGEMMRRMAHLPVGDFTLPVTLVNDFSDGAMLAAWLVAGFALIRKKSPASSV
jgi:hypothetical protein